MRLYRSIGGGRGGGARRRRRSPRYDQGGTVCEASNISYPVLLLCVCTLRDMLSDGITAAAPGSRHVRCVVSCVERGSEKWEAYKLVPRLRGWVRRASGRVRRGCIPSALLKHVRIGGSWVQQYVVSVSRPEGLISSFCGAFALVDITNILFSANSESWEAGKVEGRHM